MSSRLWALAGVGLNVVIKVWGAAGKGGMQVAGSPFQPATSLKLKGGGHAGQGWFRNGGARLEGPDTPLPLNPKICVELVA